MQIKKGIVCHTQDVFSLQLEKNGTCNRSQAKIYLMFNLMAVMLRMPAGCLSSSHDGNLAASMT